MKKLLFSAFIAATCVVMTGCGPSNRDRLIEAMNQVITDQKELKRELEKELSNFDEASKDEQLKMADYAELFALIKKSSGNLLSMRELKTTVGKMFEDKSADERKELLKKYRAEIKGK